jgi:hypothetical protein
MRLTVMLGTCLAVISWSALVQAVECDDAANTCKYTITITEPSKTQADLPLMNYKQTNIKTSVNGGAYATIIVPATSVNGGGQAVREVTIATVPCAKTTLDVKVSGTNVLGAEGGERVATGSPVIRDRTLDPLCAPAPPSLRVE